MTETGESPRRTKKKYRFSYLSEKLRFEKIKSLLKKKEREREDMLSRLRDAIFYEGKLCENPPATEQGRSTTSWHARSIRFPRPYHHLTSNFKLYPISHLKPTGTYTGQPTLPFRIYCPNFSLYHAFWTESCWVKCCPTGAGEYNDTVISTFISSFISIFHRRNVAVRVPTFGDSEVRTALERLRSKY